MATVPCINPAHGVVNHLAGSAAAAECQRSAPGAGGKTLPLGGAPVSATQRVSRVIDPTQRVWPVELFEQEPNIEVTESGLRGNPTMTVSFPGEPDRFVTFVADDGMEGPVDAKTPSAFAPSIVELIHFKDDENWSGVNVSDYLKGGQGYYGSPSVGVDAEGNLTYPGHTGPYERVSGHVPIGSLADEEPFVDDLSELADDDALSDMDINPDWIASDGRRAESHILPLLARNEQAAAWFREHAPRDED